MWEAIPRRKWSEVLASLPESKVIHSVKWQYREAVRQRLIMAVAAMSVGGSYLGMNAENRGAARPHESPAGLPE